MPDHVARRTEAARVAERQARLAAPRWSPIEALADDGARRALALGDADPALDRLARLATRLLGVPVALVSLVGPEGQVFPGQAGLDPGSPFERGTPLTHSFCKTVVATRGPVTTEDARRDERFSANPAVPDLDVVAYAGWPLLTSGGDALGAMCAIDVGPRSWSADDLAVLEDLAGAAVDELEGRAARQIAEEALRRDHHIAETLQQSLLPETLPTAEGVELAGRYRPSEHLIGGDWYDAFRLPGHRIGVAIGDVVGHGIEAAAAAVRLRNALRGAVLEDDHPGRVVGRLNELAHATPDAAYSSVAFGVLDVAGRTWAWSRAGHPPLIVRDATATEVDTGPRSPLLAIPEAGSAYPVATRRLERGTTLVLHTDGLVERRDRPYDDGLERLRALVEAGPEDPAALTDGLVDGMLEEPARDDVAVLAVRLR